MNRHITGCVATLLALGAALAACAPLAAAQALRDPTRPPVIFGRTGAGGNVSRTRDAEWVLQSVLLSPERRYAIINGEVLALGGSVAGAELVAIREGEVTLRAGGVCCARYGFSRRGHAQRKPCRSYTAAGRGQAARQRAHPPARLTMRLDNARDRERKGRNEKVFPAVSDPRVECVRHAVRRALRQRQERDGERLAPADRR